MSINQKIRTSREKYTTLQANFPYADSLPVMTLLLL